MASHAPGQPNLYTLEHGSLKVTYGLLGLTGPSPHFTYVNDGQSHEFTGGEIKRTETPIGALVSVIVAPSGDGDTTIFSLLVPNVNLSGQSSCPIRTFGVTTVRHSTIVGPPAGQGDEYTISHMLEGTAEIVRS